ncbi:UNVERIFIED_CONTAM: hypothetical protein Sradi_0860900 [Sesamum radiatum]|uniref:Uncharacterized protein n=1 Tax=Sesamum radiatum TaxID=300843 RepID=A0AAW2V1S0_SESRA
MEVFKKVYKKKDDDQWNGSRAEDVAAVEGTLGRREQHDEPAPSSQASVTPYEQQLWMSAVGGRKRGRVIGLGS